MIPPRTAFLSPTLPLRQPTLRQPLPVDRRPTRVQCQPRMASSVTVVSQVAAVAAVSAGAFYFVRGKKKSGVKTTDAKKEDSKEVDAKKADKKTDEKPEGRTGGKKAPTTAVKENTKEGAKEGAKKDPKKDMKRGGKKDVKVRAGGGKPQQSKQSQQSEREDGGIIGLTARRGVVISQRDPKLEKALNTPAPEPQPLVLKSVGLDIEDYMEGKDKKAPPKKDTKPVDDALEWAGSILSGLDSVRGVLVASGSGDVVWGAGPLIGDTAYLGEIVDRVKRGKSVEVMTERVRDFLPFLAEGAEGATVLPIGDDGGVLVLASTEGAFFGPVEERMATAVAMRLASVLKPLRQY